VTIVGGFDVHRAQITFDYLDTESGETGTGQIRPATRLVLRTWLTRFGGRRDVAFAVEACTGWRFVVEELQLAGFQAHLAETTDTATLRGRKQRAKTERADARLLRTLLLERRLPEAWIAPPEVLEVRALTRLYVALMADHRAWQQRIHAQLFHQGVPAIASLLTADGAAALAQAELSPAGRQLVHTATTAMATLRDSIVPLRRQLEAIGAAQPLVRALTRWFGIGLLTGTIIWAELGDCDRFSHPNQVVRFAGLDVSVWSSSTRRATGHLARQGSPQLRWALFEAGKCAARQGSPDYAYYTLLRTRLTAKQTTLSVARKLAHRCYHTLRQVAAEAASTAHGRSLTAAA
jgi:transposase